MYPLEKYKYYQAGNKVIAVSTFAGRTVRGVAKCNPKDNFDLEKGKMLAALRCNEKVAKRRFARAQKKCADAADDYFKADRVYENAILYEEDSYEEWVKASEMVEDFCSGI
jgi:hypothetical protein